MTEKQAKKVEMWLDETGEYYPWLEELWAYAVRSGESGRPQEPIAISDMPVPELSFLVDYLEKIRTDSGLLSKMTYYAKTYPNPEDLPDQGCSALFTYHCMTG